MFLAILIGFATAACPFAKHLPANCSDVPPHDHFKTDPDDGQTTYLGCKCTSSCGATIDFGNANCDWCFTDDKCGSWSYSRFKYYDYCKYPMKDERANWNTKHINTWTQITTDPTPNYYPNILGMLSESIQTTFDDEWDFMPAGRQKFIHSVGAMCLINWDIIVDTYTGILKQGTAHGMVRMGSASDVQTSGGMTPGNGFKFFRTGKNSANLVTLHDLNAQKGYNFFTNSQSNHIAPPSGVTAALAKKFEQASTCVSMVGLSDLCKYDQDGVKPDKVVFPYQLNFVPTETAKKVMPDSPGFETAQLMKYMETIPAGTQLYDIFAKSSPMDGWNHIGTMTTTSQCTASKYGDTRLMIRHQRIEEDWQIMPQWLSDINGPDECGTKSISIYPPDNCSKENLKENLEV